MATQDFAPLAPTPDATFHPLASDGGAIAGPRITDPLPGLVADYWRAVERWLDAGRAPGAGDFDTPDALHWQAERDRLRYLIQRTPAVTTEGIVAQVEFMRRDYAVGDPYADDAVAADVPIAFLDVILGGLRGL